MPYGLINADVMQTSTPNGVLGAKNASTLQNRLINAGFAINQRGYVSGTALSAGAYAHDRFKAGASGCTYTFTQGSLGVPIVITITAGSLQQVIEGCNMPDGGTYVLSWTGTAQARFNGGGYSTSPLIVTGLTAGANCTVEFNTGTCSFPQLEVGSSATGFEYVNYQTSLANCQRYYEIAGSGIVGIPNSATQIFAVINYKVEKRATPSLSISTSTPLCRQYSLGDRTGSGSTVSTSYADSYSGSFMITGFSGATTGSPGAFNTAGLFQLSAEL